MKMQNRLSALTMGLLAASLLASTASFAAPNYKGEAVTTYKDAAPCPQPLMLKDGFYVGGQVGYDSYNVRSSSSTAFGGGASLASNPVIGAAGWVGGLFLGYGQYFNNMAYLGIELFGNDSGASQSTTSTAVFGPGLGSVAGTNKINVNGSWGISVLPGMKLNDATLGYIRLGYERARFHNNYSITSTVPGATGSDSASTNKWQSGFQYGLGVETAFYENWSARAEFTHTNYSSYTNTGAISSVTYNPSDNQFMLGLIYHFA